MTSPPRISPGTAAEIGRVNELIVTAIGRATGTGPPNLFTTLARHRGLFRPWLRFAGKLMPGGSLPRTDSELLILRVAHNCGCEYEWHHHERIAQSVGLSADDVARVAEPGATERWSARQIALLQAADELHERGEISDELWERLRGECSEVELIELCMLVGHYEMLAMTLNSLRVQPDSFGAPGGRQGLLAGSLLGGRRRKSRGHRRDGATEGLAGRRVLITGAARGIGAATAKRLHERGASVVVAGIEPDLLDKVAAACDGLALACDVRNRDHVESAVREAVAHLGGLDIVIANAGVAAQLPLVGGDPAVFENTLAVNLLGAYYTFRAAGPHISHPQGYALAIASLAAAVHLPMMGAYNASKAAVEALGNTLRIELRPSGGRVGIGYFAEIDTDMTARGFGTEAAARLTRRTARFTRVAPLHEAIDAIERGVAQRSRRIVAPGWVGSVLPVRDLAQRAIERAIPAADLNAALEIARRENAPLTTRLPAS